MLGEPLPLPWESVCGGVWLTETLFLSSISKRQPFPQWSLEQLQCVHLLHVLARFVFLQFLSATSPGPLLNSLSIRNSTWSLIYFWYKCTWHTSWQPTHHHTGRAWSPGTEAGQSEEGHIGFGGWRFGKSLTLRRDQPWAAHCQDSKRHCPELQGRAVYRYRDLSPDAVATTAN